MVLLEGSDFDILTSRIRYIRVPFAYLLYFPRGLEFRVWLEFSFSFDFI
jgi:hypothetical protein